MKGKSFYTEKMNDESAVYFTEEFFDIKNDGTLDVTFELQKAINRVVLKDGYGVLFVPEGKYLLSSTIYIPKAVRIIGYGEHRPEFILKDNAIDFDKPLQDDKGHFRYLFWFVNERVTGRTNLNENDANPGTFYSAISNVNVSLGNGNGYAVAFRTHYAQNSFLAHIKINVESGMAGIYDVGNEMEDIEINGGQYGIITTKCSPGWPFVMIDTRFRNQKAAAIRTHEAGLTIIRIHVQNTPKFIDVDRDYFEKIYVEDSVFENVKCMLDIAQYNNSMTQVNIRNCYTNNVSVLAAYKDSHNTTTEISPDENRIISYVHGIQVTDMQQDKQLIDELQIVKEDIDYSILQTNLKEIPSMKKWINVKEKGLRGDGRTDDTKALLQLVEEYEFLYFPQGEYLFTEQIKLKSNTMFIGMNPVSTQLVLKDNASMFNGFGRGIGFIESADKGNNILMGIGINTGGINPRAIALKWTANAESYVNDVKLFGGHGDLVKGTGEFKMPYNESRTADAMPERIWDYQYPSFLVTDGGGGTFKDIWSASPYTTAGFQVENTDTKSNVYCMSLEHHQRCELRMINVKNWNLYGFQTEEEDAEGEFAQPVEMHNCEKIMFAMTFHFRTIFVQKPFSYCVKLYNCKNIEFLNVHNYSQMKYTIDNFLLDVNSHIEIRPWQAARVAIKEKIKGHKLNETVKSKQLSILNDYDLPVKLFDGFRFPDGGVCDNEGNFYFLDSKDKRAYKIDRDTLQIQMIFESPFKINSIGFDTENNIIIVGEYINTIKKIEGGKILENSLPPDSSGTSYGYWYNKDASTVVFTLDEMNQIIPLPKIEIGDMQPEKVLYPGNRWRDGTDFTDVVQYNPHTAFAAPDKKTIIPEHYDLIRATNLAEARPGSKLYSVDEMYKCVYSCNVIKNGLLTNPIKVVEEGDYCTKLHNGYLYVGDENIKIYKDGDLMGQIRFPERPSTFDFGGSNKDILFATARGSVYAVKLSKEEEII